MTDKKTINLINNIKLLLDESIKLHKIYKDNGSKFLYTKKILVINKKILTIIDNKVFLIPNQLKEPFFILKKHITEWIYCWNQNKNKLKPVDIDVFIFHGYSTFPTGFDNALSSFLKNEEY
tara:strand:+ start:345 stop:707 length:363 start_codon:yes stop_codon:yes gene_type:complete